MSLLEQQEKYNYNSNEKDLVRAISSGANQGLSQNENHIFINYISNLINLKRQEKILEEQKGFNTKILNTNKKLVFATWVLVIANTILIIANIILMFLK